MAFGGFGGFGAAASSSGGFGGFGGAAQAPAVGGFGTGFNAPQQQQQPQQQQAVAANQGLPAWDWTLAELEEYSTKNKTMHYNLFKDLYSRRVHHDKTGREILSKVQGSGVGSGRGGQPALERLRDMVNEVKALREGPESAMGFLRYAEQLRLDTKGSDGEGGIKAQIRDLRQVTESVDARARSDPAATTAREVQHEHEFVLRCTEDMVRRVDEAAHQLSALQREIQCAQSGGSVSSNTLAELIEKHYRFYTILAGRVQDLQDRIDPLREHYKLQYNLPASFFETLQARREKQSDELRNRYNHIHRKAAEGTDGTAAGSSSAAGGFGGFGASSSGAGGFGGFGPASSATAIGGFSGFGATSSAAAGGFGGFGASSSAAGGGFGGFGAASSAAAGGGFGGFGASSSAAAPAAGGFGGFGAAPASSGGFGGFGAAPAAGAQGGAQSKRSKKPGNRR